MIKLLLAILMLSLPSLAQARGSSGGSKHSYGSSHSGSHSSHSYTSRK